MHLAACACSILHDLSGLKTPPTRGYILKLTHKGMSEYAFGILNWLGNRTYQAWKNAAKNFTYPNERLLLHFYVHCDILLGNRFESARSTSQQGGTGGLNALSRFEETQVS